jgi:hypothetical protein
MPVRIRQPDPNAYSVVKRKDNVTAGPWTSSPNGGSSTGPGTAGGPVSLAAAAVLGESVSRVASPADWPATLDGKHRNRRRPRSSCCVNEGYTVRPSPSQRTSSSLGQEARRTRSVIAYAAVCVR